MAMPALSGPRSVMMTSISDSMAPNCGSRLLSFKNNPTIPHMGTILRFVDERWIAGAFFDFNCEESYFLFRQYKYRYRPSFRQAVLSCLKVVRNCRTAGGLVAPPRTPPGSSGQNVPRWKNRWRRRFQKWKAGFAATVAAHDPAAASDIQEERTSPSGWKRGDRGGAVKHRPASPWPADQAAPRWSLPSSPAPSASPDDGPRNAPQATPAG